MAEDTLTSAKVHTELSYPDKHGTILYKELHALESMKNIRDERLDLAKPPEETAHVFYLYWNRFRGIGLSYQELKAYQELTGEELEQWEIDLLFSIHAKVENTIAELVEKNRPKK